MTFLDSPDIEELLPNFSLHAVALSTVLQSTAGVHIDRLLGKLLIKTCGRQRLSD